jgi:hypothetical protein
MGIDAFSKFKDVFSEFRILDDTLVYTLSIS